MQEITVCDPVKFSLDMDLNIDQMILLPWVPSVNQEVELKATGGHFLLFVTMLCVQ